MKHIRQLPAGITILILSIAVMALGSAVASLLEGHLVVNFSPQSNQSGAPAWVLDDPDIEPGDNVELPANATFMLVTYTINNVTYYAIFNVTAKPVTLYDTNDTNITIVDTASVAQNKGVLAWDTSSNRAGEVDIKNFNGYSKRIKHSDIFVDAQYFGAVYHVTTVTPPPPPGAGGSNSNNNNVLDLGFIPGLVVVFAGLYMFLKGMRMVAARV